MTAALQALLMRCIDLLAQWYVNLNPYPMRLEINTYERRPSGADPKPKYTYAEWLEACYNQPPSPETRQG